MQVAVLLAAITFAVFKFSPWDAILEKTQEPTDSAAPKNETLSRQQNDCRYTDSPVPVRTLKAPEKSTTGHESAEYESRADSEDQEIDQDSGDVDHSGNSSDTPTSSTPSADNQ